MRNLMIILASLSLLLCGCNHPDGFDKDYLKDPSQRIIFEGKTVLSYEPLTCQRSVSSSRLDYRIFKDDLSAYYTVSLGSLPAKEEQEISGCSVKWTGPDKLYSLSGITLKVKAINSDEIVWLWDEYNQLAIVLQLL